MSKQKLDFQPVNCMTGTDYEKWVLQLLTAVGISAKRTGKDDNGVDIIAEYEINGFKLKFYIQCKFYNKTLGKTPIQEVYTGCSYFGNDGFPVVVTNNRFTRDALEYAKAVGVEVIGQHEFNELAAIVRNKYPIEKINSHIGLMGIIIGQHYNQADYIEKSINSYYQAEMTEIENDRTEKLKDEINSIFDEAEQLVREASNLQMQSSLKLEQALKLQRSALVSHLNYPDTSIKMNGGEMMADDFEKLLDSIGSLSPEQIERLTQAIVRKQQAEQEKLKDVNEIFGFKPCANCGSVNTKKYGHVRGKQRYWCKDCHKTFGATTGTITIYSKLNEQQWKGIIRGLINNHSMSQIAKEVHISAPNVWINKIKICTALLCLYGEQDSFVDIAECDEYYAPTSFKGKRDPAFFMEILNRMPRHHWSREKKIEWLDKHGYYADLMNDPAELERVLDSGDHKKRGISDDQTCILTCQDRSGNLVMVPVGLGTLETEDIKKYLHGKMAKDSIMVTDSHGSYPKFAEGEEIQLEQIPSGEHTKGAFNLARINSLHSEIAVYWNKHRENIPATKYMDLSLIFFWWLKKNAKLSVDAQVDELYKIITDPSLNLDLRYETITDRIITINTKSLIPESITKL